HDEDTHNMTQLPLWTKNLHHDGSEAYISNPVPKIGESIKLKLRVPADAPIRAIFIRAMLDGEFHLEEMQKLVSNNKVAHWWQGNLPIKQHHIPYRFKIMTDEGAYYYTAQGTRRADTPDFEDFIILGDYDA